MAKKQSEKRKEPRIPVRIRIQYETADKFFEDYIRNLSLGGIFVETSKPLPVHTKLKIQLSLPEMEEPLVVDGVVVHTLRVGREAAQPVNGMGIKFSTLDNQSKQLLEEYLQNNSLAV